MSDTLAAAAIGGLLGDLLSSEVTLPVARQGRLSAEASAQADREASEQPWPAERQTGERRRIQFDTVADLGTLADDSGEHRAFGG